MTNPIPPRCTDHARRTSGCPACCARQAWRRRQHRNDAARGITSRVPPDQARAHVLELRAQGMSLTHVAKRSGVDRRTLVELVGGRTGFMLRVNAEALLAVKATLSPHDRVDATGVRRRMQALARMGYRTADLGLELGVGADRAGELMYAERVTVDVRDRALAAYDRLSMTPGPSRRVAGEAMARGWVSPLAWDDETIDDPAAVPVLDVRPEAGDLEPGTLDPNRVERAIAGDGMPWRDLNRAERNAVVTELAALYPDPVIAAKLRTNRETICKHRERNGIPAFIPRPARSEAVA